jgi:hypothetical protein
LVTVAPGVAFPTKYAFVTPTVGLEGDNDPVSVTVAAFTVRLIVREALAAPLVPCSVMLLYVPAVVLDEVWIVKVACADPPDGTVTEDDGDQDAVAPGI